MYFNYLLELDNRLISFTEELGLFYVFINLLSELHKNSVISVNDDKLSSSSNECCDIAMGFPAKSFFTSDQLYPNRIFQSWFRNTVVNDSLQIIDIVYLYIYF